MDAIRHIIKHAEKPSLLRSVPWNFGEAKAGTLKADELRTLFTVYIPIILVLKLGKGSTHPDARSAAYARVVLENTMHLVCAVILACKRTTSFERAERYRSHMKAYVEGFRDGQLYPDFKPKGNHHIAFHIYDFLILFGPMLSWWCFGFERLIGHLQRTPHNHRIGEGIPLNLELSLTYGTGELEATIHTTFVRASNLKRWLSRFDESSLIAVFKRKVFDPFFKPKGNSGESLSDELVSAATYVSVPRDLQPLAQAGSSKIILKAFHHAHDVAYWRASSKAGKSLICFLPGGLVKTNLVYASIKYIFVKEGRVRFAVHRQMDAQGIDDPFAEFPDFPCKIFSSTLSIDLEEVEVDWVLGTYLRYEWPELPGYVIAESFLRVCTFCLTRVARPNMVQLGLNIQSKAILRSVHF